MSQPTPDWDHYRSFLAVLDEGSLSAAARTLGLAQPSLSRHVAALEHAVGCTLFLRTSHGLAPTQAARELAPHARAMAASAAAALRATSGHATQASGTIRVTASEVMGAERLPPILAALRARHPGLVVELALSNALDDLLRRDADIAVRMAPPRQEALLARRLGVIELGLHAHRAYLARCGTPATAAELDTHALIGFDRETPGLRAMRERAPADIARFLHRDRFALRTDSDLAQLAAIRAGFGIGICQASLAAADPALVRLLPDFRLDLPSWVVMHEDLKSSLRCRIVFDALAEGLRPFLVPSRP